MRSLRRIVMVLVLSLPAASAHAQSPGQPYSPPFPGQFPSQFPPGQFPGQFPGPDARPADPLDSHPCFSEDHDKHLKACTELLDQPGLAPGVRSSAHAMRALSLSILGKFDESIADYDAAIQLNPNFAVALNNRAWAYFKWGKPHLGLADVENSLALDSSSPHSYDTRAHGRHQRGDGRLQPRHVHGRHKDGQALPVRLGGGRRLQRPRRRENLAGPLHGVPALRRENLVRSPPGRRRMPRGVVLDPKPEG
jgi:TPR repeat